MIAKRVRFAGFLAGLSASHESLAVTFRVANLPWTLFYLAVRKVLRILHLVRRPPSVVARHPPQDLPEEIAAVQWYHTIDLGGGVVTPGVFDHRPLMPWYRLPDRMDGLRVLDVATWDGFWAFEFERRGAAEVVALDLASHGDVDLSPAVRRRMMEGEGAEVLNRKTGRGFELARERLGSSVIRRTISVYDLSPDVVGTFDVVHVGDLLLHLKYPLRALENVLSVTAGYAIISEAYFPELDALGKERVLRYMSGEKDTIWWEFSLGVLQQMIRDAGFERIDMMNTFPFGGLLGHVVMHAYPGASAG